MNPLKHICLDTCQDEKCCKIDIVNTYVGELNVKYIENESSFRPSKHGSFTLTILLCMGYF